MAVSFGNIYDVIVRFGGYYRKKYAVEMNIVRLMPAISKLLNMQDVAYFERIFC